MKGKNTWATRRQMFIWPKAGPIASIERFEEFVNSSFSCEIEYAGEAFKEKTGDVDVIFFLNPKDNDNMLFTLFCENVGIERISLEWKFKGYSNTSVKRFFH